MNLFKRMERAVNVWFERLGRAVNNWLEQLAEENEKSFSGGKLDCCTLNRHIIKKTHYKNK